jgi:hypothetical protein
VWCTYLGGGGHVDLVSRKNAANLEVGVVGQFLEDTAETNEYVLVDVLVIAARSALEVLDDLLGDLDAANSTMVAEAVVSGLEANNDGGNNDERNDEDAFHHGLAWKGVWRC